MKRCYEIAPPRVQQYLDAEVRHVLSRIQPGDSVLELGCGYGRVTLRLAEIAGSVTGIDTARDSLELARDFAAQRPGCNFIEMDAAEMTFEDGRFDVVVCVQNGVCAFGVDQVRLLTESLRVTRPGGLVIFSSYADGFWPERLAWFELQSKQGLLGELDADACRDGVIVCRDGFRAGAMNAEAFARLCDSLGLTPRIQMIDGSSVFCELVKPPGELGSLITDTVRRVVNEAGAATRYREPLVGFAAAGDGRFRELATLAAPGHKRPEELLPGAASVVSFFLPFSDEVVEANAGSQRDVAREWALAYTETNALIERICAELASELARLDVRSASEPPTGRFDRTRLVSQWSHKSVACIAGLGSFGIHRMLITDMGCAGRFGSVVIDGEIPASRGHGAERCLHLASGLCLACVSRCPAGALGKDGSLDRQRCWERCRSVGAEFSDLGGPQVCGKCAVGPCATGSPGLTDVS